MRLFDKTDKTNKTYFIYLCLRVNRIYTGEVSCKKNLLKSMQKRGGFFLLFT